MAPVALGLRSGPLSLSLEALGIIRALTTTHRFTKVIGYAMMTVGFGGLALFLVPVVLICLATPTGVLIAAMVVFGVICRLCRYRPSLRLMALLLFCGGGALAGYYRFYTAEGSLARYGVHFNPDAVNYESYSLNTAQFWFDGPSGRLAGPEVTGTLLTVETPHHTADGQVEFAVSTGVYDQNNRVWIQLVLPPRGEQAFHVVLPEHTMVSVRYPIEGLSGAP